MEDNHLEANLRAHNQHGSVCKYSKWSPHEGKVVVEVSQLYRHIAKLRITPKK
jgi:hypothetical protein